MTALAKVEDKSQLMIKQSYFPTQAEMEEMVNITKVLATCPYYQKLGAGGVLAIWLTAREMNLPPMMCLNGGLYTFSGQVTMSSKLMNMMITRAGHRVDILESTITKCRLRFWRSDRPKGNDSMEWEYTIEDARGANLTNKQNWKTNTRDMLFNRCMSGGAGKFMADVTMGAYLIGEMPGDDELVDTIPDEIKTVPQENADVKPLYIENVSEQEAYELISFHSGCSPSAKQGFDKKLEKLNVGSYYSLPKSEYAGFKVLLEERYKHNQKAELEKEMANKSMPIKGDDEGVFE
jgi:hypothetical protein